MRGGQPWKTNRSRLLRSQSGFAERKLWDVLRDRRLEGTSSRAKPQSTSTSQTTCRDAMLVIEVDGATHSTDTKKAADAGRTAELRALGYRVLRESCPSRYPPAPSTPYSGHGTRTFLQGIALRAVITFPIYAYKFR